MNDYQFDEIAAVLNTLAIELRNINETLTKIKETLDKWPK